MRCGGAGAGAAEQGQGGAGRGPCRAPPLQSSQPPTAEGARQPGRPRRAYQIGPIGPTLLVVSSMWHLTHPNQKSTSEPWDAPTPSSGMRDGTPDCSVRPMSPTRYLRMGQRGETRSHDSHQKGAKAGI